MGTPAAAALIVDDEASLCAILGRLLGKAGYEVDAVGSGEGAVGRVASANPDVIFMDLALPGMDGIETMEALRRRGCDSEIIVMTAYGSVDTAVRAIKLGAFHYVEKPFDNNEIVALANRAAEHRRLRHEVRELRGQLSRQYSLEGIVGVSGRMQAVLGQVVRAAASDATVMVEGESGTGKELIVRALHNQSDRKDGPFVALNCAALPQGLIENELFGHEAGAFTDARDRYQGKFEQADGGTLFLDEVGDLPVDAQAKLLRVIEQREFTRIGGSQTVSVDVRLVAATNKELGRVVREGDFREDLYYRLNVISLLLPPLRERREDIPLLAEHFIELINRDLDQVVDGIEPAAMERFAQYGWPGNVRELENVIRGAAILRTGSHIRERDLPMGIQRAGVVMGPGEATLGEQLARYESAIIAQVLEQEAHNRTRSAARLGITRKTLLAKISAYDLDRES